MVFVITVIIACLSERLVSSIYDISSAYGVSKSFVGLILLPIFGSAAEHMTAVIAAYRGKMDLAMGVATGFSTQVSLPIVPLAIMVS